MTPTLPPLTLPLGWSWRFALAAVPIGGAVVALLSGAELTGLVARGSLLGAASDAERYVALAFGLLVLPFGITALRHGHLRLTEANLEHLGFGFVCGTRVLQLAEVRRWGTALVTNRGRRERHLLFELHDRRLHTVKLAMFRSPNLVVERLTSRLGEAAPTTAAITGIRFDDPE